MNKKCKDEIEAFLKEQNFDFDQYENFIEYLKSRGVIADNEISFTQKPLKRENLEKIYQEYINPIKRVSKQLNLTYKELAEQIGYSESGLKNAIFSGKTSNSLLKALELLVQNCELKRKLELQNEILKNLNINIKGF